MEAGPLATTCLSQFVKEPKWNQMAQKLDDSEILSFKELLMANSIQVDALAQLMIRKGFITKEEFFEMLKEVQAEYEKKEPT
jgi:hypothetical protein